MPRARARRRAWLSVSKGRTAYLKIAVPLSGKVTRSTPDIDHTRTSWRVGVGRSAMTHRSVSRVEMRESSMIGSPM